MRPSQRNNDALFIYWLIDWFAICLLLYILYLKVAAKQRRAPCFAACDYVRLGAPSEVQRKAIEISKNIQECRYPKHRQPAT